MEKYFTPQEFLSVMKDQSDTVHEAEQDLRSDLMDAIGKVRKGEAPEKRKECGCPQCTIRVQFEKNHEANLEYDRLLLQSVLYITPIEAQTSPENYYRSIGAILSNGIVIGLNLAKAHYENEKLTNAMGVAQGEEIQK